MITTRQTYLILDFINTAKLNGAGMIQAALPANHPAMVSGAGVQMKCIRKVKDYLAVYVDELGLRVALMADTLLVKQF